MKKIYFYKTILKIWKCAKIIYIQNYWLKLYIDFDCQCTIWVSRRNMVTHALKSCGRSLSVFPVHYLPNFFVFGPI
jgi:hypothetical protein